MQKKSYLFTLIAFVLGTVLGLILKNEIGVLQIIGSVFVRLIKLAVAPLVLVAVVNSILNIHGKKNAIKLVAIVLTMFVVSTAISATIGIVNSLIIKPGSSKIIINSDEILTTTPPTLNEFVLNLIPTNPFSSLVEANTFHIIFLAAIIGVIIVVIGKEKLPTTVKLFEESNKIIMKYIQAIVKIAPLGVFALTANSFATYG